MVNTPPGTKRMSRGEAAETIVSVTCVISLMFALSPRPDKRIFAFCLRGLEGGLICIRCRLS